MVLYGYTHLHGQTLISAINADIFLTKAIEVENTGNFLSYCQVCKDNYAVAMCWDGIEPGVAIFDGTSSVVAGLPQNAHDPDIVFGDNGQYALVVYELNDGIAFRSYQVSYSPLSLTQLSQGTVVNDAAHPNIDMNLTGDVAVIYENNDNPSSNNYIHILLSDLTGSFWTSPPPLWAYTTSVDNKSQYVGPLQNGLCYDPDIAISGRDGLGRYVLHTAFVQANPHLVWHAAIEVVPPPTPFSFPNGYYANFDAPSGLASGMSQPRIACTKAVSTEFDYVMVHGNNNTVVQTHHISAVFGNGGLNTQIWIDWPLAVSGAGFDPALDWIDDPYLNIAWSATQAGVTDKLDICVDQRDPWSMDYYPGQWSRANSITKFDQTEVSIAGLRESALNPHLYHYFWYNPQDKELRFKVSDASATSLKRSTGQVSEAKTGVLYPNPSFGILNIKVPETAIGGEYRILNLSGQELAKGTLGADYLVIHIESLPTGLYFFQMTYGDWTTQETFIKK